MVVELVTPRPDHRSGLGPAREVVPGLDLVSEGGGERLGGRVVEPAEFLTGAAAAGVARLAAELPEITALAKAHGEEPLIAALERAVEFRRWRAADVRSILAAGIGVPVVTPPGSDLVLTLPSVPTRPLADYAIAAEGDAS